MTAFQSERQSHQTVCQFRPVHCQFSGSGCEVVLAVKVGRLTVCYFANWRPGRSFTNKLGKCVCPIISVRFQCKNSDFKFRKNLILKIFSFEKIKYMHLRRSPAVPKCSLIAGSSLAPQDLHLRNNASQWQWHRPSSDAIQEEVLNECEEWN